MRRNDFWGAGFYVLLAAATVLLCASGGLGRFNQAMPYLAGFIQFAVYATAGELLSTRILEGIWAVNRAVWFKAATWGIGGVFVTLAFTLFSAGTK